MEAGQAVPGHSAAGHSADGHSAPGPSAPGPSADARSRLTLSALSTAVGIPAGYILANRGRPGPESSESQHEVPYWQGKLILKKIMKELTPFATKLTTEQLSHQKKKTFLTFKFCQFFLLCHSGKKTVEIEITLTFRCEVIQLNH